MKQLKRCGKASRTETLLMVQMLSNSFMILINFLVAYFLGIFIVTFLGWAMLDILDRLINFNQALLFGLASSTMSILFLRKPRERARTKSTIVNQTASRYRH
ncbi:unnamed protein product, partial [Mesorhabditis belari]|uniref:Uncharacterized protein n=1 Tax=Mesorhabditis belari TaxID=2138241 RepID=A0AAF3J946_9BILA